MAKASVVHREIMSILPHLNKIGSRQVTFDFDKSADVMYISLEKPQNVTDTEIADDGTLYRYRGNKLVGITVINYSKKIKVD
ncbi:MAG TPA: DUF2283 domain-containing protein [Spirochaetota bacterium]|nr:DUF2283 domain-containing protein [Spirochaetota bacterium]HQO40913.1 DUF2283 domain-containing protein [Spirochaetota bacterium]HQP48868.1 DUF2283 domain-containing protein [Spirochaetota bacterium]